MYNIIGFLDIFTCSKCHLWSALEDCIFCYFDSQNFSFQSHNEPFFHWEDARRWWWTWMLFWCPRPHFLPIQLTAKTEVPECSFFLFFLSFLWHLILILFDWGFIYSLTSDCWLSNCWLSDCWHSDCWLSDSWISDCWLSDCWLSNESDITIDFHIYFDSWLPDSWFSDCSVHDNGLSDSWIAATDSWCRLFSTGI